MIKVFTGNVYNIQEEEYDRNALLMFFLNGHREEYLAMYRGEQLLKILSYEDILYQREVEEGFLTLSLDAFAKARSRMFCYENRLNRAIAVCNENGDMECVLHYCQNRTNYNYSVDEFETYSLGDCLDLALLERAEAYVIEIFEEYTAAIIEVILKYFPQKKILCKDENVKMFFEESEVLKVGEDESYLADVKSVMYISSQLESDFGKPKKQGLLYNSLEVMTSIFWQRMKTSMGDKNPDKEFLLIHYPLYACGLGDVIRFSLMKVAMLEHRKLPYIPVIDLSVAGDKNQFSEGKAENVWEYFFTPLNQYRPEEVKESASVLVSKYKVDAFNPYITEQYYNHEQMRAVCRKYLHLNAKMKAYLNEVREKVIPKNAKRILGVVARGTDYRYGGFDLPKPMEDQEYIVFVKEKMAEWNCDHVLVATEDGGILRQFEEAGFGEKLLYVEQERYEYTDTKKVGILVADLKRAEHSYRDEMPYLSVLYLLSECCALISNCRCGAYEIADFINGNQYENRICCVERE